MPIRHGVFHPRSWQPLSEPLFGVIPPDDPTEPGEPDEQDWQWYNGLLYDTATTVLFLVEKVRHNYVQRRGVRFDAPTVRRLRALCRQINDSYLDQQETVSWVQRQLDRMVKQWGLVVYSTEQGQRRNWPKPGIDHLDRPTATRIVDDACHQRWPGQPGAPFAPPRRHRIGL